MPYHNQYKNDMNESNLIESTTPTGLKVVKCSNMLQLSEL